MGAWQDTSRQAAFTLPFYILKCVYFDLYCLIDFFTSSSAISHLDSVDFFVPFSILSAYSSLSIYIYIYIYIYTYIHTYIHYVKVYIKKSG